jgi:hypothetical protein
MNERIESGGLFDVGSVIKGFGERNSNECWMVFGVVLSTVASVKCLVRIRTLLRRSKHDRLCNIYPPLASKPYPLHPQPTP